MASAYLTALVESRPDAAEAIQILEPLLERKYLSGSGVGHPDTDWFLCRLWHQLTVAVEEEMSKPWLQVPTRE